MNNEFKDYYRILGVTPDASMRNIEVARDRELNQSWNDPSRRLLIQEAYTVLSNLETRKNYDVVFNQMISERDRAILNARTYEELRNAQNAYPSVTYFEQMHQTIENPVISVETEEKKEEGPTSGESDTGVETPIEAEEKKEEGPTSGGSDTGVETPIEVEEKKEEGPTSEGKNTGEETLVIDEEIQQLIGKIDFNPKVKVLNSKKILPGIAVVSLAAIGMPALAVCVASGIFIAKKLKLKKSNNPKEITEFQTEESNLFDEYNRKLNEEILELLSKPHQDYKLQIAILKYENQIALLKQRIEHKKNQKVSKGGLIKYNFEVKSLENQLKKSQKNLELLKSKAIEQKKDSKLSKQNESLQQAGKEFIVEKKKQSGKKDSKSITKVKDLEVKFNSLKKKRDNMASKLVIKKDGISRNQVFLAAFDIQKKKLIDRVNNNSNVGTEMPIEVMEEEVVKTR